MEKIKKEKGEIFMVKEFDEDEMNECKLKIFRNQRKRYPALKRQIKIFEENKNWLFREDSKISEEDEFKLWYIDMNWELDNDGNEIKPFKDFEDLSNEELDKYKGYFYESKKASQKWDDIENEKFYVEFKRLNGLDDKDTYLKNIKIFLKIKI
jgi:hypothetical protein